MVKMVIVYSNAGDQWFAGVAAEERDPDDDSPAAGGYPFGGVDVPIGRYTLEGGRIKPEILAGAPLPKGHEKEALEYYGKLLLFYLKPENAKEDRTLPFGPFDDLQSPQENPVEWLENMCRVFHNVSAYEDADPDEFPPHGGGNNE